MNLSEKILQLLAHDKMLIIYFLCTKKQKKMLQAYLRQLIIYHQHRRNKPAGEFNCQPIVDLSHKRDQLQKSGVSNLTIQTLEMIFSD